jgi:hypothetical protein
MTVSSDLPAGEAAHLLAGRVLLQAGFSDGGAGDVARHYDPADIDRTSA